ncbi:MAG: hypothetical protein MdMp024_0132 [Bacteroidales bacterium]
MKINNIFLAIIATFLCIYGTKAQTIDDIGKIVVSVVIPENVSGLTATQLSNLEAKIIQITTNSGLAAVGYNQNFIIYPQIDIYENNVVEGGMQNITVITAELSLFIQQVSNNFVFASVSKRLKSNGKNTELALTNAITQISVSDKNFISFIKKGKEKILQYYEESYDDIMRKADAYIKLQQYQQALVLLMGVPEEVSYYDKVLNKSIDIYKAYQKQTCSEQIHRAKAMSATMDYEEALNILTEIDPSTNCIKEAQLLVKSIESELSAEKNRQWNFQMQQYNDAVSLQKQRLNAIKEIAVAYYKNQPTNTNYYHTIIK